LSCIIQTLKPIACCKWLNMMMVLPYMNDMCTPKLVYLYVFLLSECLYPIASVDSLHTDMKYRWAYHGQKPTVAWNPPLWGCCKSKQVFNLLHCLTLSPSRNLHVEASAWTRQ
jgi:hypothetical protein